jgi:TRAP-type C4-dicarboxylate transport system permease small subunit
MSGKTFGAPLVRLLAALERAVISGLMALITLLTLAQVFWRYVLEQPLQWSEELARYGFVWVTFLGAAVLFRLPDGHPAIDAMYVNAGPNMQRVMDIVRRLVVIAGSLAIAVGGFRMVQLQWNQLSPSIELPMAWIYLAMFVGPLIGVFWLVWCDRRGSVEDEV